MPLRWLLVDEFTMGQPDTAVAVCVDIDGLFVDPPLAAPAERYTLLGCAPAGRLRAAVEATVPVWLGNLVLDAVHHPNHPRANGCDPVPVGCSACMEEPLDLTVVAQRPSTLDSTLLDIDVEGYIRRVPRYTSRTMATAPEAAGYRLTGDADEPLGQCREVAGVFWPRPDPPVHPVTLRGCRPEPPLRAAIDALRAGAGNPGGALHRRRIDATILSVTVDGLASADAGHLQGSVAGARASTLGEGLLDVTFDTGVEAMPAAAQQIWERWRTGPPRQRNQWAGYDRELRHQWAGAAMRHRLGPEPDQPAGATYHLDGRYVTDIEGFYCAIGEAVNGPGGFFGWNLASLDDCLCCGGGGALSPFRLVWHDSDVARTHLVSGYDRRECWPAVTLEDLLQLLAQYGIEVDLR